jgi:hypothetical protein
MESNKITPNEEAQKLIEILNQKAIENGEKDFAQPQDQPGNQVKVNFNLKQKTVTLYFGNNSFALSVAVARDVALALRQAANQVEKFA